MKFDPKEAVRHLSKTDKVMKDLIRRVGPCDLKAYTRDTPYDALVRSIVFQQLSGKAASTIHGRMLELFPDRKLLVPQEVIDMPHEKFRGAGLSRSKTLSVKDLSEKVLAGIVPEKKLIRKMSDQEIIERLVQVRGIGQWTVEMLLIFHLGRMDVLPATDYGVRKGFALTYRKRKLPEPKRLLKYGEIWAPYRSVAAWYLWRSLDLKD